MLGAETRLLPHAAELARLHAEELPQKDELCGAFNTLLTLRLAHIRGAGGEPLDQDTVGQAAGSVLGPEHYDEDLPPGETGRKDYRLSHPRAAAEIAGTSAGGLVRAVAELSAGRRVAVPLIGPWTVETVERLLDIAHAEKDAALVLNVGTRFFWGSRPSVAELLGYLETGDAETGPEPDWTVGHFVGCLGVLHGARGRLVIISDTYASLGLHGVHLQPIERVAAALRRDGMTPGGVLLMLPGARRDALSSTLVRAGLELGVWDNGSLDAVAQPQSVAAPR
jgi:hypothetical protein